MIYDSRALQDCRCRFWFAEGATMYELLGALAFAAVVVGYVLAVIFVKHGDGLGRGHSHRPDSG
jgi:hypothetical protein